MKEKQLQQLMQEEAAAVMEDSELRITLPEPHGSFDREAKLLSIRDMASTGRTRKTSLYLRKLILWCRLGPGSLLWAGTDAAKPAF